MTSRTEVDGKARIGGRTLNQWASDIVERVVAGCNPVRVIVFGSVARGDDGPDSDIDLLVELDSIARVRRRSGWSRSATWSRLL